ncbi:Anthranilate synthase, amidotransferase component @ Para-aminobenzoate synthase, amidotransferase component [hydrothermal vent metagenome]|uniref:Anthranilate synthase, amidotransferase component @ Para-aminobenzoate synthase, amidotransferase component n=1 Tax=hydrothermal vent metagenome TaxID=652676 RepID=A0A1W1CE61_9ZZZZ
MLLMIDNYDSFTYNIVQYFGELGQKIEVYRNDKITLQQIKDKNPKYIVISPGPCSPTQAGISLEVVNHFKNIIPILGVCLGHQTIVQAFSGDIVQAKEIKHGKLSKIHHNNKGVFTGLPQLYNATRYHSLVANKQTMPKCLEITAWSEDNQGNFDEIMGIKHKEYAIEGVQFHPESILTEHGHQLFENFLKEYKT